MGQNSSIVQVVNIQQKLSLFSEHWNPKIIGELNDHKVQVIEPKVAVNTGNVTPDKTVAQQEKI
jgi:hypothetical protein